MRLVGVRASRLLLNSEISQSCKEAIPMNYRKTKLYKTLDDYTACAIAEGFSGETHTEAEILTAWQYLVDTGLCWHLQGWYGRTATNFIEQGLIQPVKRI